jgi:hypothetical protein
MKTAIAAAILLIVLPAIANADVLYDDAITFGPSYAIGPPAGFPWGTPPDPGAPLFIIGLVTEVDAPFSDVMPPGAWEMTYVIQGGIGGAYGMWDDMPCSGGMFSSFYGGMMSIYLDTTPDADFMNAPTFQDGELVLQAQVQAIDITDDDPYENCPMVDDRPDVRMYFAFSGGAWLYKVMSGGIGLSAIGDGELPGHYPELVPEALRSLGYMLRIDGTMDIFGPVKTRPVTWGHVKAMYR